MVVNGSSARADVEAQLRDLRLVDDAALSRAAQLARQSRRPLEQVLNQMGALPDQVLADLYAAGAGIAVWEPQAIAPAAPRPDVNVDFLRRARLLPLAQAQDRLACAACDPLDVESLEGLAFATGLEVDVLAARPSDWRRVFDQVYADFGTADKGGADESAPGDLDVIDARGGESAGGRLVMTAFEAAVAAGASDIHFEPGRHAMTIRLRVDGRLLPHRVVAPDLAAPVVSRVKVIANLDLGERRLPQDGRTTFVIAGRQVDVRVATAPTVFGESAVLRILDRASVPLDLERLGLGSKEVDVLRQVARLPHGLFLVSGPTGSGKTTTLYALLQTLAGSELKILSVEDPVEYHFEHVAQTQVAPAIGLTFARALRAFLRQNPNVILVGEIRDPETAEVALQAAMTGHLVLASIHANDALGVVPRLLDMGVQPFQLNAALRGASAQRLVRRLCPSCRRSRAPTCAEVELAQGLGGDAPEALGEAVGCEQCGGSGYRGRLAIGEGFLVDEERLRRLSGSEGSQAQAVGRDLIGGGMLLDGLRKASEGLTTLEEVRVSVSA